MSYRRNYRRPYRSHRYYRKKDNSFELIKGVFIIGTALIILRSIPTLTSGSIFNVSWSIVRWALILGGIVLLFKKIKLVPDKGTSSSLKSDQQQYPIDTTRINSEKHGCKCYMEGLTSGEQEIAHILAEGLSYKDYFIFNNLTIPSSYNGSSQIDHLVVSKFGIFVIESKDYNGWIFGSANQEKWTQSLAGGNHKSQFQNPIRQNWSHIMSLKALLPFVAEDAFQNIVVFTNSCEIKTPPIENVIMQSTLIECIQKYAEIKINEDGLLRIIGNLSYTCQTADITPEQHVENLQAQHNDKIQ